MSSAQHRCIAVAQKSRGDFATDEEKVIALGATVMIVESLLPTLICGLIFRADGP